MKELSLSGKSLSKVYLLSGSATSEKRALDDVTFSFSEGERIGIIGENGAGKTTLLQILAGISTPSSGRISVNGRVTSIFTLGLGLRDDLSGRENIFIDGELQGRSRVETDALIEQIVDFAELQEFIDRPVRTYSTGMKARLAFSMVVHIDPEILVIDEALSVGDAKFSIKATAKMRELTQKGRILIFVSHSMMAVREMCSRCLWIHEGRIRMDDDPTIVTQAYLDHVRKIDDQLLLQRFRKEIVEETLISGWEIECLELCESPNGPSIKVPQSTEPTSLRMEVSCPPSKNLRAALSFKRLDGLFVCRTTSDQNVSIRSNRYGRARFAADLGPLPLNAGIYSVTLDVSTDEMTTCRRAILFEVVNPHPHPGGRPVLVIPISTSVTGIP